MKYEIVVNMQIFSGIVAWWHSSRYQTVSWGVSKSN